MLGENEYTTGEDEYSPLLGSRVQSNGHATINGVPISKPGAPVETLEPLEQYRSRWRSIRIMYLTMFLGSVTFTITVSSLWPFLQVLNPFDTASFLGWVVAAYSLGQLIASPFFGAWSAFRNNAREPLATSLFLTVGFNVLYMYLQSFPNNADVYMIVARGLIGFSAGNVAVVRSYISGATTMKERTACMGNVSIFQAMGFVLGPVFQSALVPIGFPGLIESPSFHFNMYTAPAFFASILALVNLLLVLFVFKEHKINCLEEATESAKPIQGDDLTNTLDSAGSIEDPYINGYLPKSQKQRLEDEKPDYIGVLSVIFLFFIVLVVFTVFETIGTALTMHMYAWTKSEATLYQGIILGVGAVWSVGAVTIAKILAKWWNERSILLLGLILCFFAFILFIPMGTKLPPVSIAELSNTSYDTPNKTLLVLPEYTLESNADERQNQEIFDASLLVDRAVFETSSTKPSIKTDPKVLEYSGSGNNWMWRQDSKDRKVPQSSGSVQSYDMHGSNDLTLQRQIRSASVVALNNVKTLPKTDEPTTINTDDSTPSTTDLPTKVTTENHTTTYSSTTPTTPSTTTINTTTTTATKTTTTPIIPPTHGNRSVTPEGCPWQYSWCEHVPYLPLPQYLGATLVMCTGYPMAQMITNAIFSKILGPQPQGVWMGWLTAAGCLARTIGPIYVSQIYDSYGPQITFGSVAGIIFCATIFLLCVFKHIVPYKGGIESSVSKATQGPRQTA